MTPVGEGELSFWRRSRRLDRLVVRYVMVLAAVLGIVVATFALLENLDAQFGTADAERYAAQRLLHAEADEQAALSRFAATSNRSYLQEYLVARRELLDRLTFLRNRETSTPAVARDVEAFARAHERWERAIAGPTFADRDRASRGLTETMHASMGALDLYYARAIGRIERERKFVRYGSYAFILLVILLVATYGYYSERASAHREERLLRSVLGQRDTVARQSEWRTKIIAILAHDFRTSLAVIQANAELLETHPNTYLRANAYRAIYKGVSDLASMTDEALLMVRVANDTLVIAPAPVFIYDLIAEVADRFAVRQDIRVSLSEDYVKGDEAYLARVFDNVISNAVKYSNGPIDVRIDGHDKTVDVTVTDRGPGIDAADLPHVFEEYWRAESVRGQRGSGIGLYIVKKIVDAHHGTVDITSTPDACTTVRISLPRAEPPEPKVPV